MKNDFLKNPSFCILHFTFSICLSICLSGCFKEPQPAYETVPAETQVYLKGKGLTTLTTEALMKDGLVFLDDRAGSSDEQTFEGGHYTNLSARVETLDPTSFTYLNLDYNELTNVDAVVAFTGLKWLRLNNNRLSALPDLSALVKLRRVYLRDNVFTEVPAELDRLPSLDSLDLSGNPIAEVPEWLAKREGLQHLSLSNTAITRLPADLSAWKSLKALQLGGLKLESLEELKRIRAALPSTTVVF